MKIPPNHFEQHPLSMLAASSQYAEIALQYPLSMLARSWSASSQISETTFSASSQINVYRYSHRRGPSPVYLPSRIVSLLTECDPARTYQRRKKNGK